MELPAPPSRTASWHQPAMTIASLVLSAASPHVRAHDGRNSDERVHDESVHADCGIMVRRATRDGLACGSNVTRVHRRRRAQSVVCRAQSRCARLSCCLHCPPSTSERGFSRICSLRDPDSPITSGRALAPIFRCSTLPPSKPALVACDRCTTWMRCMLRTRASEASKSGAMPGRIHRRSCC